MDFFGCFDDKLKSKIEQNQFLRKKNKKVILQYTGKKIRNKTHPPVSYMGWCTMKPYGFGMMGLVLSASH